jgi:hypothetical protein
MKLSRAIELLKAAARRDAARRAAFVEDVAYAMRGDPEKLKAHLQLLQDES